jgi:hypothetical protein
MPDLEKHCADCKNQLGEDFHEVHEWLDEFFPQMGPKHRVERHHTAGVEEVRKKFGDRAAIAAEIHIRADCDGKIPTMQEIELWKLFTWGK